MDSVSARLACALGAALLLGACQRIDVGQVGNGGPSGESPRGRGGEDEDDEGREHRPGSRCGDCHSEESGGEGPAFVLAGTVYARASDPVGAEGAIVHVVDAAGHDFGLSTYRGGNFMVSRDQLPWPLVFPLRVDVTLADGTNRVMRSRIQREGSCAGCHAFAGADESHVDRIWVIEEP
jgi:mono/diheme cytochrome c family protein